MALVLPTTWAMRALDGVTWQGSDWAAVAGNIGVIAAFTVGLTLAAMRRLRAQEVRRYAGRS